MVSKRTGRFVVGPAKRRRTAGRFSLSYRRMGKYARARRGLARFAYSRKRLASSKRLSNLINKISETKLLGLNPYNELQPGAIQTGAQAYYQGFHIGPKPTSWTGGWATLGGIEIAQGITSQEREGNYVYLDHTRVALNIDTSGGDSYRPPMEYRVIVGKSRRGVNPAGITQDPATDLFIDEIGAPFGHRTSGKNGSDLMLQPLNKRDWYIKMDRKFTMSCPLENSGGGYTGKYPTTKNMAIRLPYCKKTKYGTQTATAPIQNKPIDLDYSWFILVYARSQQKDQIANDWETNVRGTTCFKDV